MVLLSSFGLLLTWVFFIVFLYKFDVCMIEKKTHCIGLLYTQTSQIDCFRRVHKILR